MDLGLYGKIAIWKQKRKLASAIMKGEINNANEILVMLRLLGEK